MGIFQSIYEDMTIIMEVSPLMSMPSIQQGYINLNVGGTFFTTSRDTLTRYPGSTLHSMFSKDGISTVPKDDLGRFIIDRDGSVFGFILNFLRSGSLNLPTDFTAHEQLIDEADYFQLPDMKKLIITRVRCVHY
ncbi:BTB/POZ domain-containing protein KCTD8 [Holothuria leucospilota]|uniref:BTB/POZ domain-containing protein KCTD8 n=1 Tax=Holothuria leucospilota TaxID=206669 RepID=A0A9Q0YTM1_HOLLE|nr:BTB/POZ domain-containing protein KCTD8 [Holothuria leucospilota]